jgi:hypothetical protein
MFSIISEDITPLSLLIRAHAPDQIPPIDFGYPIICGGTGDWLRTRYLLHESKTDDLNAYKVSDLWQTQSRQYVGPAVVALATNPDLMQKTGQRHRTGDLGREYGFTDIDGRHPGEPA